MRGASSRLLRRRRGAAAIEFALCLPWICYILFGILEYGWVFFQHANVIAAVRSGVRYAATQPASSTVEADAETLVRDTLTGLGFNPSNVSTALITATRNGSYPTETITVRAEVPYSPIAGLVPTPDEINYEMTMLMEQ